jgi:hypothetical protein
MAYFIDLYLKKEHLEVMLKAVTQRNQPGIGITVVVNNEVKEFTTNDGKILQQNASAFVSQSKEDREAKKDKYYIGNGRQVWGDGVLAPTLKLYKEEATAAAAYAPTASVQLTPNNPQTLTDTLNDNLPF